MAAPQPPPMTQEQQDLCHTTFTNITTYLANLTNTRVHGTALSTLRTVPFVTAFRSANLRRQQIAVALPQDVS